MCNQNLVDKVIIFRSSSPFLHHQPAFFAPFPTCSSQCAWLEAPVPPRGASGLLMRSLCGTASSAQWMSPGLAARAWWHEVLPEGSRCRAGAWGVLRQGADLRRMYKGGGGEGGVVAAVVVVVVLLLVLVLVIVLLVYRRNRTVGSSFACLAGCCCRDSTKDPNC